MPNASFDHPVASLVALFGAGLLTSLSPCIFPMIPITVGIISGSSAGGATPRSRVVGRTLTYILGLALLYALMGLVAGLTGTLFGTVASNPYVRVAIANLLVLFALALLDVFPVNVPQRLASWAGGLSGGSYPAVFLLGATSGIVAAPCGAPAFAAVLTWVAATHSGVLGFVYLFVFSLGMTAVLAAAGLFSGLLTVLPKPGPWMAWIKRLSAVVLLLVAEYYLIQVGKTL
ncbi:MAG TPA: cytochrome c biogenesis protein CcdA [Gemmatimonadales bacterium]|nr:cytochrome c biogenesis protein CcdA [Gemmatimonadales bacterium]